MRQNHPVREDLFQPLEARRLLSFNVFGPETVVPIDFGDNEKATAFAVAGDGSFLVAALALGGDSGIQVIRYSAAGQQIGSPLNLQTPGEKDNYLSASMDADGDAIIAYSTYVNDQGIDNVLEKVYVRRISRTGEVGAPVLLDSFRSNWGGNFFVGLDGLDISLDDAGGFFVGWMPRFEIKIRAFDAADAPRGDTFTAYSHAISLESAGGLDLAANPDGSGATFAFGYWHGDAVESSVKFGQLTASGPRDPEEPIKPAGLAGSSNVAILKDGSSVIAGGSFDRWEFDYDSSVVRFSAAGERHEELIRLGATGPSDDIHSPSIDAMPDGGFVVTFTHSKVIQGPLVGDVYVQRFAADGTPEPSGSVVIPGPRSGARIGVDAIGRAVLLYHDEAGSLRFRRATASFALLDGSELYVSGTEANDHIIVERVRENLFVNVNGIVQRFDTSAVQFLSISGLGGDDDIINASALPATIHGGDGFDTIWGGTGPDRIRGFGGDDRLFGGDGDDQLLGDSGSDAVSGGDDDDNLLGDVGEDTLIGGSGNDLLLGHRGSDSLYGEAGNDVLLGGDADDYLEAGAGNDELYGQAGRDALFGLTGNDRLFADDAAADTVRGGPGDDSGNVDDEDDVLDVEALT